MTRIRSGKLSSKYRWNSSCRRSVLFMFFGDVAGEGASADDLIIIHDRIEHALEIEHSRVVLQLDLYDARPAPSLQKSRQTTPRIAECGFEDEFIGFVADDLGI